MKKLIFSLCLLCLSVAVKAQFEQGKWIVNPSLSGLNLSRSKATGKNIGIDGQVGSFLADNTALIVGMGAKWTDHLDTYYASVGTRYYLNNIGLYLGVGVKLNHLDYGSTNTNIGSYGEVGFAFFISKTVTIEPAVYYDLSFKNKDYSTLGFKLGFGLYF